jgi:hypothetical protein
MQCVTQCRRLHFFVSRAAEITSEMSHWVKSHFRNINVAIYQELVTWHFSTTSLDRRPIDPHS